MGADKQLADLNGEIADLEQQLAELQRRVASGQHTLTTMLLIHATVEKLRRLRELKAQLEKRVS